jgi:hypothetical protein
MFRFIIVFLLTLLLNSISSIDVLFAGDKATTQKSYGPNSPNVSTRNGDVTININTDEKIRKALEEYCESYNNDIAKLRNRLAELHKTEFPALSDEADKWADQFISTLPLRKDKFISQKNEGKTHFDKMKTNLPFLFNYTIKMFDEYIVALIKKYNQNIKLIQIQIPEVIVYSPSLRLTSRPFRTVIFPNGISIEVTLFPGYIENGKFISYPTLSFYEVFHSNKTSVLSVSQLVPNIGGGGDVYYGDGSLNDGFKKALSKAYDKIIGAAYLRLSTN